MEPDRNDLDFCTTITRRGGSNLWLVSRSLPGPKRALFAATYASMRFIDDFVDEEFQAQEAPARERMRPQALAEIERWLDQCRVALSGGGLLDNGHPIAPAFRALQATAGHSDIGTTCWEGLARAMEADIRERPLVSWDDFDAYAEGATVCPTAVFLYILLCDHDCRQGIYRMDDAEDLIAMARHMGSFCYLIHILRDLRKDREAGGQVLTVPRMTLNLVDDCWQADLADWQPIVADLLDQAKKHQEAMDNQVDRLKRRMAPRERMVFSSLLGIYKTMYARIRSNPAAFLAVSQPQLENEARASAGLTPARPI